MSGSIKLQHSPSWIPSSFVWDIVADAFVIKVSVDDPDLVEFIALGERWVDLHRSRAKAMLMANLLGAEFLRGQLEAAAWSVLRRTEDWKSRFAKIKLYCRGVFRLPSDQELLVLVGWNPYPYSELQQFDSVRTLALEQLKAHEVEVYAFEKQLEQGKQEQKEFQERHPEMEKYWGIAEASISIKELHQRPVITAEHLLSYLAKAVIFPVTAISRTGAIERTATQAIKDSGWGPSRDGDYVGLIGLWHNEYRKGLLTWQPHRGPPAYPEVRWVVQRRLRKALSKPRHAHIGRPEFDSGIESSTQLVETVAGFDPAGQNWLDALQDIQLDQSDYRQRVDKIREEQLGQGFEAIAWFQPYHSYTEDVWGIYFDARKLDDLALIIFDDCRLQHIKLSHSAAAYLAFGLTCAHELFHARVEAALSWQEVNTLQPRYLHYKRRVYDELRETPEWLEEALANWTAWSWFQSETIQTLFAKRISNIDGLSRIVEALLDLSPPGYREWRAGNQPITWRTFGTQLSTGQFKQIRKFIGLPLESTLQGPFPYDFLARDVPYRFVGSGVIADRLLSHPSTFNVPTRREIERALKFFKHIVDPAGGKGGHQKWTGPDNRAFILPTRDPVSVGVFKTFLKHLGIDKSTYLREVRPNL